MSKQAEVVTLKSYPHHNMWKYCENRPKYRQGRKLTAVKVYTVNDESQHLLIRGVPSVDLRDEVEKLCTRYGNVLDIRQVQFEDQEEFTHSFHVIFVQIQSARFAKKQIDTKNFFGGVLHACYGPELETVKQTRAKLQTRISEVTRHINKIGLHNNCKNKVTLVSIQHDPAMSSHNIKSSNCSSQNKKNRWLEGGLQCSYIIPKPDPLDTTKKTVKNSLDVVNNLTSLDSKTLRFLPRQLSTAVPETKVKKKSNRIIFH